MYIFDIDMTLADCTHRLHHIIGKNASQWDDRDWTAYDKELMSDTPIMPMIELCRLINARYPVILLTGRGERSRKQTIEWLDKYDVPYDTLLMRPLNDRRKDTIVKLDLLDANFTQKQLKNLVTVFEDRTRIVDAFRARGFHVCQVAKGDY